MFVHLWLSGLEETEVETSWKAPQEAYEHLLSETVSLVLYLGPLMTWFFHCCCSWQLKREMKNNNQCEEQVYLRFGSM